MIARVTGVLLALALLLVLLVLSALWSTAGTRLLIRMAEEALDPALSVTGVSGSILSDLCADEVRYQADGLSVLIEEVCVNPRLWSSVDFLKVDVETFSAASVEVLTQAADAEAVDEQADLSLPVGIAADAVAVQRLRVDALQLMQIQASLDLTNTDLQLAGTFAYEAFPVELSTSGGWSDLRFDVLVHGARLKGEVDLIAGQLPWTASVSSELLDLAPFTDRPIDVRALKLTGAGDLSSYRFDATGRIQDELGRTAFSLAGAGDLEGLQFERFDLTYLELIETPVQIDALRSRGALNWAPGFRFELNELSLLGNALDLPLAAGARKLVLTDTDLELTAAAINIDDRAEARLNGRIAFEGELDLALKTERLPLALADPRLGGLADVQATIGGTLAVPSINGTAAVAELTWESEAVGDLNASLEGSLQHGDLLLALTSPEITGEIALDYQQVDSDYLIGVRIAEGRFAPLAVQAALREPVSVRIGEDRVAFEQVCLSLTSDQLEADPGYLCAGPGLPWRWLAAGSRALAGAAFAVTGQPSDRER